MRRFSANYVYPVNGAPIKNGIVLVDDNNTILGVTDPGDRLQELASMEFHNGVIVPGFVNAHCHLELSHLKGKVEQSNGIAEFVCNVRTLRKSEQHEIEYAIKQTVRTLENNGTVAVGDICNTSDTIGSKLKSKILFHNFIELFGLSPGDAKIRIDNSIDLLEKFRSSGFETSSLTPHAPYSISDSLWNLLTVEISKVKFPIISIHFGESKAEYTLLNDHSGALAESYNKLGIPINLPDCKSPLEVVLRYIPKDAKVLFVHNTFVGRNEVVQLASFFKESFFVLCPSSNLFIEGVLPDVQMIASAGVNIALGTDSYASSNTVSVFDQIMILLEHFPFLTFDEVLKWATLNGAKALNFDSMVGTLDEGKSPGLNLISHFDFTSMKPTSHSRIKRLI
jgi:cytosine/adenosine deaminase-related metal-dependent hydrolase